MWREKCLFVSTGSAFEEFGGIVGPNIGSVKVYRSVRLIKVIKVLGIVRAVKPVRIVGMVRMDRRIKVARMVRKMRVARFPKGHCSIPDAHSRKPGRRGQARVRLGEAGR